MELKEQVRKVVAETVVVDRLKGDDQKLTDLGLDSLDMVELTMSLEEKFDIDVTDDEMEKFQTVNDVIRFVEKKENERTKEAT